MARRTYQWSDSPAAHWCVHLTVLLLVQFMSMSRRDFRFFHLQVPSAVLGDAVDHRTCDFSYYAFRVRVNRGRARRRVWRRRGRLGPC
jgi:hypothetical protein